MNIVFEIYASVVPKVGSQKRIFHSPVIFLDYVNRYMGIIGRSVQYDHQNDIKINIGQSYS